MATHGTILIVDDEWGVREVLCDALSFYGYRVITAASVQEAERALRRRGAASVNLVVADINLTSAYEAREGYGLYQRWRALDPALPFILISGDATSQALPAVRSGAVRFLYKPFGIDVFLRVVQEVLGG